MKLKLLFFGVLTDAVGMANKEVVTDSLNNVQLLDNYLKIHYPLMAKYKYKIAVNQKMAEASHLLNEGDEIAFLPPFSGG